MLQLFLTNVPTFTLVPTLIFACRPIARKVTEILSCSRMRTPTWWFKARKTGLKDTKGEEATELDQFQALTLLPA